MFDAWLPIRLYWLDMHWLDPTANLTSHPVSAIPTAINESCVFDRLGLQVRGYVSQGYNFNSRNAGAPFFNLPGGGFAGRSNDYMLNQIWLNIQRPVKAEPGAFDIGVARLRNGCDSDDVPWPGSYR